jgi:lysophospholipase L1-like esterase
MIFNGLSANKKKALSNTVGTLYEKSSWSDLSDFATFGTGGASIVSNKIKFQGGANNFANGIYLNRTPTCLYNYTITMRFTIDLNSSTTAYAAVGQRSINTFANNQYSVVGGYSLGPIKIGTTAQSLNLPTFNTVASTAAIASSVGDTMEVTFQRRRSTFLLKVKNLTTQNAKTQSTQGYSPNTGQFAIINGGGEFTVTYLKIESDEQTRVRLLCVGDSKTQGAGVSAESCFQYLLNNNYSIVGNNSGGADTTVQLVARLNEILSINPQNFLCEIGCNDIRFGVSTATWQANINTINSTLLASGINLVWMVIEPDATSNQAPLKTYLAGLGARVVNPTGVDMQGDGIHPTELGHSQIASSVVSSGYII